MTDGQLVGIVLLLAMAAVLIVWGTRRATYREEDEAQANALRAEVDRSVDRASTLPDPEPLLPETATGTPLHDALLARHRATARALADTAAEFRDRAEAGRALVGKGLGWRR